ncbi:hypothetical protein SAMN04488045_2829 [Thalassococcus halodurans]|uniref:Uncharacterized protein n=1 Tax=Thalassococcus halodurans TaxID=373675 RepID=A0A1H6A6P0_9RHOB|nr:hypothetical protein [Thalassococcus halodurans]SEG43396.1 hypothetical protein SAMN04488045_2829 [Thalassococcus halodurans]
MTFHKCNNPDPSTCAPWCGKDLRKARVLSIFFDPPMAIARVGSAKEPMPAYRWKMDEDPHHGMQTMIVPAPSLTRESIHGNGHHPYKLKVTQEPVIHFKDHKGRIKPVAPFFELWARLQDLDGQVYAVPVTEDLLKRYHADLRSLEFTVSAGNRKAEARVKDAACAVIAHKVFHADSYKSHHLDAISPHTEGQVPMARPDAPVPLGKVQTFMPNFDDWSCKTRLDQIRLRFTPGKGDSFGPPEASQAIASPRQPGDFEPEITEYGRIHKMTKPENRILSSDTPWLGYSFGHDDTPKWPTPMDSYDGARVGPGHSWGLIDDTCDLIITARLAVNGHLLTAQARSFAGPPDFAPDKRPMYSIQDELEDRELPLQEPDLDTTPDEILDLFRRIFETASLVNLDQRRAWATGGNASLISSESPDNPHWDDGISPKLGPASMRRRDKPYADLVPDYTPGQGETRVPVSGDDDRLPYTQVVQQVHARMADSPVLRAFLTRRPDRVRELVRPPFAKLSDLPKRVGIQKPAEVPVGKWRVTGVMPDEPSDKPPLRYRDPREVMDQTYDMRMPPYMRHSMGVPLTITRRQYTLLLAYLDKLETDPEWRKPVMPEPTGDHA